MPIENGVNQGCPLSLTLFGLCINKLEEIIKKVAKEEGLNEPKLMHELNLYSYMLMMLFYSHIIWMICNT